MKTYFSIVLFLISCLLGFSQNETSIFNWEEANSLPLKQGLNGAFVGTHNNTIIFAGGTNFPNKPVWKGGAKKWYQNIYTLSANDKEPTWKLANIKLPKAMANGVSVSTSQGVLCIGGDNETDVFNKVFLLKWNATKKSVEIENLPPLPITLSNMGGSVIDDIVYIVGGQQTKGGKSTSNFLSFNLKAALNRKLYTWKQLDSLPAKHRIQPVVIGQSDGHQNSLYVFSGLAYTPNAQPLYTMLSDVYMYNPLSKKWVKKQDIPNNGTPQLKGGYMAAAPAIKRGNAHILIFGGAGGKNQELANRLTILNSIKKLQAKTTPDTTKISNLKLKDVELVKNTSFSKTIWAYHTITDTWSKRGQIPYPTQIVTNAIEIDDEIYIAGGEISPGVRTNKVVKAVQKPYKTEFGIINYITLISYLLIMILIGWYFSRRNKTTNDYFLGGGRIPWWAAGLSIYATMLSAITYLSQPALAYSFDWQAYLGYFSILLIVPIVITFYLPFFRKLNITTAYEYLEKRFNISVRLFGSTSFVLFQLVRMGIVVYLPALALSTVIGMNIYLAIIIMGILAVAYTYMGGIEAVIWTDVIQVLVLIIGLIVGIIYIIVDLGSISYIFDTAIADNKFKMFDWRLSYTEVVTWSLFIGSFALNFAPYTTDQAVIQRYMTTANEKESRKSIWLNGIISIPAGILIFTLGTFLYVYFKNHPDYLVVGMQNDGIFPLFISNHLPQGIAGLVIAGIYSASMSSLDSSMHSISTVVTVDYYQRFSKKYTEEKGLKIAKYITVFVGLLGTLIACLMAAFPVKSLFFFFQEVIGLFGSALTGIFALGIFVKKANWKGTLIGAFLSVIVLAFIKYNTHINFYIYPLIAIPVCILGGYIFSYIFPVEQKDIKNLTYDKKQAKKMY